MPAWMKILIVALALRWRGFRCCLPAPGRQYGEAACVVLSGICGGFGRVRVDLLRTAARSDVDFARVDGPEPFFDILPGVGPVD